MAGRSRRKGSNVQPPPLLPFILLLLVHSKEPDEKKVDNKTDKGIYSFFPPHDRIDTRNRGRRLHVDGPRYKAILLILGRPRL